jgi:hypothetical protein
MIISSSSALFISIAFLAPSIEGATLVCCFPAGTLITMADGSLKPIEEIKVGDIVLSYDIEKDMLIPGKVLKRVEVTREGVYSINNGLIKPTDDHPLYVEKPDGRRGWAAINLGRSEIGYGHKPTMILEVGDKLLTSDGSWVTVKSIVFQAGTLKTFTFMVDNELESYIANGFVVSNAIDVPGSCCVKDADCGIDYCTAWSDPYCDGDTVKKKRTCYDYYCSSGSCGVKTSTQYTTVTTCSDTTSYSYTCSGNDVYKITCTTDYYCSSGSCVKGSTICDSGVYVETCPSGTTYGDWIYYCDGSAVKKKRNVTEKGCSDGACYSNSYWEIVTVDSDCNNHDGYYDTGNTRVTTPSLSLSPSTIYVGTTLAGSGSGSVRQKEQIYRDYYCSSGSCIYTSGSTRWVDLADTVTYEYRYYNVNDGVYRTDWITGGYTITQSDAHDTIRVYARAVSSGDYSSTTYVDKTVANSAPSTPTSLGSSPSTVYVGNTLSGSASGSSDPDGDSITYEYRYYNVNDGVYRTDWITGGYTITQSDAHDTIRIYTRAKDSFASAVSGTTYKDISIANSVPVITSIPDKSVNEGNTLTFDMGYSDADGDTVTWSVSDDYTYSASWDANHTNEQYTVTIAVSDGYGGSDTESFILSVTDVNRNPIINSLTVSSATINTTENITFTSSVSDPENDALTYEWQILNATGAVIKTYSNANSILEHQFKRAGLFKVKLIVTDTYSGSANQIVESITVKQKVVISPGKNVTFIPWQSADKKVSEIATAFNLHNGDVIKKFNPSTGKYSIAWVVDPTINQNDFTIKKGDMIRVELVNETSRTNGITATISTVDSSDSPVEVPLNYTYDSPTKSGNPGYNYVAWVSEKVITADQLAQQIGLARGQTISKYDPDSDSWQGYIYKIGLQNTSLNFNIYPGDVICIKINEGVAGKKLVLKSNDIQVASSIS